MKKQKKLFVVLTLITCFFMAGCSKGTEVISIEKFNAKLSSLKNNPNLVLVSKEEREIVYSHRLRVLGLDSRDAEKYREKFPEDVIFFSGDGAGETVSTIYTSYPEKRIKYFGKEM